MPFVRINYIPLKEGGANRLKAVQAKFLAENDPAKSGCLGAFFGFSADERFCRGVTIWRDQESLDASNWPRTIDGIRDILDGEAQREELEIDSHNLTFSVS